MSIYPSIITKRMKVATHHQPYMCKQYKKKFYTIMIGNVSRNFDLVYFLLKPLAYSNTTPSTNPTTQRIMAKTFESNK